MENCIVKEYHRLATQGYPYGGWLGRPNSNTFADGLLKACGVQQILGRRVSHHTLRDEREALIRKVIELSVVLAFFSVLIWLSVGLQGPFAMTGSASVVILGIAFLAAFLRFIIFQWRSAMWFFVGVLLATLWYPIAYTAIDSAYANGPGLSGLRFYMNLLLALRIEAVYRPLLMLLAASLGGGALGYIVGRLFPRAPNQAGLR